MEEKDIISMSIKELKRLHVIEKVTDKQITQKQAADMLNLSERQFRRIIKKVMVEGSKGVIHKLRGRISNRILPTEVKENSVRLYKDKYNGFGPTLEQQRAGSGLAMQHFRPKEIEGRIFTIDN